MGRQRKVASLLMRCRDPCCVRHCTACLSTTLSTPPWQSLQQRTSQRTCRSLPCCCWPPLLATALKQRATTRIPGRSRRHAGLCSRRSSRSIAGRQGCRCALQTGARRHESTLDGLDSTSRHHVSHAEGPAAPCAAAACGGGSTGGGSRCPPAAPPLLFLPHISCACSHPVSRTLGTGPATQSRHSRAPLLPCTVLLPPALPSPSAPIAPRLPSPFLGRYGNFMQKGIELAKEAVEEDRKENWAAALDLYKRALEYFGTHLKYDKNPKSREMISNKVGEWWGAVFGAGGCWWVRMGAGGCFLRGGYQLDGLHALHEWGIAAAQAPSFSVDRLPLQRTLPPPWLPTWPAVQGVSGQGGIPEGGAGWAATCSRVGRRQRQRGSGSGQGSAPSRRRRRRRGRRRRQVGACEWGSADKLCPTVGRLALRLFATQAALPPELQSSNSAPCSPMAHDFFLHFLLQLLLLLPLPLPSPTAGGAGAHEELPGQRHPGGEAKRQMG